MKTEEDLRFSRGLLNAIDIYNYKRRALNMIMILEEDELSLQDMGKFLYPNSSDISVRVNMNQIINGKRPKISTVWVKRLCVLLETTPNNLFGYDDDEQKFI